MINIEQYLLAPCAASSIPFWKAQQITLPENMKVLHDIEFKADLLERYTDEPYFRLLHDLQDLKKPMLPKGFVITNATQKEYAEHISLCYGMNMTEVQIDSFIDRNVYHPDLWIAIRELDSGEIVATGIAEIDKQIGEGSLEWIQVSPNYRGKGLATYIVQTLLGRLSSIAYFVTVSGQCNNPTDPEKLYRNCGFKGTDIWHILRQRI